MAFCSTLIFFLEWTKTVLKEKQFSSVWNLCCWLCFQNTKWLEVPASITCINSNLAGNSAAYWFLQCNRISFLKNVHNCFQFCDTLTLTPDFLRNGSTTYDLEPKCGAPDRISGQRISDLSQLELACRPKVSPTSSYQEIFQVHFCPSHLYLILLWQKG